MSLDIDMKNFTLSGEAEVPAAVEQVVDTNSYQQEANGEFQQVVDPLDQASVTTSEAPVTKEPQVVEQVNKQELNFKALREEVDRIKAEKEAEKREYQLQLEMLRANVERQRAPQQPEPSVKKMFDGMKEDDVPNVRELRQEWEAREANYQSRLEELQVQQMHPDYAEVIEKYALPLVKQKPHLAEGLQGARNKALFAYELGKMAQQMHAPQVPQTQAPVAPQRSELAQKIVENSKKPGTLSQASGQSTLSKADYFASMSDQEFMKMATKNLEGI